MVVAGTARLRRGPAMHEGQGWYDDLGISRRSADSGCALWMDPAGCDDVKVSIIVVLTMGACCHREQI